MEEKKYTCDGCGNDFYESDLTPIENSYLCDDCLNRDTFTCRNCGERHWVEEAVDGDLCIGCYDDGYVRCSHCGNVISEDSAYYYDNDTYHDSPYCSDCFDNCVIHDYYYKPHPIFFGRGPLYFGVELEVDDGGESEEYAKEILSIANRHHEYMYIKHDGSLENGFECVTHPMTLEYHTNHVPWEEILETAVSLGYLSHCSDSCGMHVHISRKALGNTYEEEECTIAKILYFYEKFWDEILKFSRRTEFQVQRWARRYGGGIINPKETLKHAKNSHMGRYAAVNLENDNTIEMRIFRGTLKYNTFIATLQMVDEICKVAISLSDEFIQRMTWLDFVKQIPNDKYELITYLKERLLYVNEPVTIEEEI